MERIGKWCWIGLKLIYLFLIFHGMDSAEKDRYEAAREKWLRKLANDNNPKSDAWKQHSYTPDEWESFLKTTGFERLAI